MHREVDVDEDTLIIDYFAGPWLRDLYSRSPHYDVSKSAEENEKEFSLAWTGAIKDFLATERWTEFELAEMIFDKPFAGHLERKGELA
ncbi:MAG: hypothetical protein R3C18_21230 [Planctomycetaceae bacterium]